MSCIAVFPKTEENNSRRELENPAHFPKYSVEFPERFWDINDDQDMAPKWPQHLAQKTFHYKVSI